MCSAVLKSLQSLKARRARMVVVSVTWQPLSASCQSKQSSLSTSALISQQTLAAASSCQTPPYKWQQFERLAGDAAMKLHLMLHFIVSKSHYKLLFCSPEAHCCSHFQRAFAMSHLISVSLVIRLNSLPSPRFDSLTLIG